MIRRVHTWVRTPTARRASAWTGVTASATTIVVAMTLLSHPSLVPTGLLGATVLSVLILSLPVWAAGIAYVRCAGSSNGPPRVGRAIDGGALGSLGLLAVGLIARVPAVEPARIVGDLLYALGTVVLLAVSIASLVAETDEPGSE